MPILISMRRAGKRRKRRKRGVGLLRGGQRNTKNQKSRVGVRKVEISSIIDKQPGEMSLQSQNGSRTLDPFWLLEIGGARNGIAGSVGAYLAKAINTIFGSGATAHYRDCPSGAPWCLC